MAAYHGKAPTAHATGAHTIEMTWARGREMTRRLMRIEDDQIAVTFKAAQIGRH